ncbi:ankyrin repeat domain-containing protein [Thiohalocapsa marina]|nr:ankyrin repeat domain-containing protein [Thiohalocapsa marina]
MRLAPTTLLSVCLLALVAGCGAPPEPTVNLYRAVHIGDLDQIKRHLFWKTDINQPGADGAYPLHVAVSQGRVAIARELLDHGADTDVRDRLGRTPLHLALANGKLPAAELLWQHGTDDDPQALLFQLVADQTADRDSLHFLLSQGAALNTAGPSGTPPLHQAVSAGNVKLAKHLISAGAEVNLTDTAGNTPLALAERIPDPSTAGIMAGLLRQYGALQ